MAGSFDGVKEVIAEVMKLDAKDLTLETKFIEDLKAEFYGSILPDRWLL